MFWFLLGLSFAGDGTPGNLSPLGTIPLRCLYALEQSDADYVRCRRPSLTGELAASSAIYPGSASLCYKAWETAGNRTSDAQKASCDVEWHLNIEIKTLRALAERQTRR